MSSLLKVCFWSRLYDSWRRLGFRRNAYQVSLGCGLVAGFQGILMLKDTMTGHLTRCGGADPHKLLTSAFSG